MPISFDLEMISLIMNAFGFRPSSGSDEDSIIIGQLFDILLELILFTLLLEYITLLLVFEFNLFDFISIFGISFI